MPCSSYLTNLPNYTISDFLTSKSLIIRFRDIYHYVDSSLNEINIYIYIYIYPRLVNSAGSMAREQIGKKLVNLILSSNWWWMAANGFFLEKLASTFLKRLCVNFIFRERKKLKCYNMKVCEWTMIPGQPFVPWSVLILSFIKLVCQNFLDVYTNFLAGPV